MKTLSTNTGRKATPTIYETSPLKRIRRSEEQMDSLLEAITTIIAGEEAQITIRHLFYRLVGLRQIEKTESAYKSLCAHLSKWRRSGEVAWDSFADNTRWHLGRQTFDSLDDALNNTATCYRRNLWSSQDAYVEIWGEKDAISGILYSEADTFGVKVFTCRGFASLSALYSAANTFKSAVANGKEVLVYYFGDHDPSGLAIDRAAGDSFRNDFGVEVKLTRAAVTPEQITQHDLPTRPMKKGDMRGKDWKGGCVEVDTMPPAVLKRIVRDCITRHIDAHAWNQIEAIEEQERETLRQVASNMRRVA